MNRSKVLAVFLVALVVILASGLVVVILTKTQTTAPTVTFTKQTIVEVDEINSCTDTIGYSPYTTSTTTIETTYSPSSLPTEYPYIVTIVTVSTVYSYTQGPMTC